MKAEERRQRIIEMLGKELRNVFEMGLKQSPFDAENSEFYLPMIDLTITPKLADAIMAIPLDIPTDEEIEEILWEEIHIPLSEQDKLNNTENYIFYKEVFLWVRWMRDEIIKRNEEE